MSQMFAEIQDFVVENSSKLSTTVALVVVSLSIFVWWRRHLYVISWKCHGPVYKPLFGNIFDFGTSAQSLYETLHQIAIKYESPQRAWFGPFLCCLLTNPDDIQILLKHENAMEKPFVYGFAKDWVGDGIITSKVNVWRSHRKLIAPTFSRKILENYMQTFVKQSNVLVNQISAHCGKGKKVDVFDFISRCTLDIICETSMGTDIKTQKGDEFGDIYIKSTQKAFEILYTRVMKTWYAFEPIYKLSSLRHEFKECCQVFHKLTDKVIDEKRNTQEKSMGGKRQKTFVDELFHQASIDNENWTNKEIRDEISSMIAAGADTTSHSLSFTILLLAMFPDVQDKVVQEINSIECFIEGDDERFNIETCNKMIYTGQVIKESLRLFPPSTIIGRYTNGDVQIKTNNLVIPSDVFVIVGISMLHRDKTVWGAEADKFNPDNFSRENIAKRHPNAFLAFSGGQRNCVGLKFANLSMKVILYKLLKAYRLETDEKFEDIRCEFKLLMKKVGGVKIMLSPRK